ncbi:MAG: hypothetical protein ABIW49_01410 [Knoellia sp.]
MVLVLREVAFSGWNFHVTEPPELVEHLRILGRRYARAVTSG